MERILASARRTHELAAPLCEVVRLPAQGRDVVWRPELTWVRKAMLTSQRRAKSRTPPARRIQSHAHGHVGNRPLRFFSLMFLSGQILLGSTHDGWR